MVNKFSNLEIKNQFFSLFKSASKKNQTALKGHWDFKNQDYNGEKWNTSIHGIEGGAGRAHPSPTQNDPKAPP